ncbi:MAG: nitronate monooxygenase, partial [Deltaproteobacteria bacterium]
QLGKGLEIIEGVHAYGGVAMPTITSEKHALSAERAGADAVLATGHEAAAHGERVGSMVLIPAVVRAVKIPVVAAGGFADGAGLAAALSLGATAIGMGTRFAATRESALHAAMKEIITGKSQTETLYTDNFDGMWARIMQTDLSERLTRRPMSFLRAALEATKAARSIGRPVAQVLAGLVAAPQKVRMLAYFGAALPRVERATVQGDVATGVQFIGEAQGLVQDIPAAGTVVTRTVAEAEAILRDLASATSA